MNKLSYAIYKLGMMDRFGYTAVHAFIDFGIMVAIIASVLKLVL